MLRINRRLILGASNLKVKMSQQNPLLVLESVARRLGHEVFASNIFNRLSTDGYPFFDISERPNGYLIEIAVAGFEKSDLKVQLNGDTIDVFGDRKTENKAVYFARTISRKSFKRSFTIPSGATIGDVEYLNGILAISVKLPEPEKPVVQEIQIK